MLHNPTGLSQQQLQHYLQASKQKNLQRRVNWGCKSSPSFSKSSRDCNKLAALGISYLLQQAACALLNGATVVKNIINIKVRSDDLCD